MLTDDLIRKAQQLSVQFMAAKKRHETESLFLVKAQEKLLTVEQGQKMVQEIAASVQENAHTQIASLVTRAVKAVFGEEYEFFIDFQKKRGKTEARLMFKKNGQEISPQHGSGGGLLDVATYFLNLVCILMYRPYLRRLFVSDEPFRHLDREKASAVKELIEEISEELDVQIIIVTHSRELACGKIINVTHV